jgi:uncharacterized coiled-coil DUF342 family protein
MSDHLNGVLRTICEALDAQREELRALREEFAAISSRSGQSSLLSEASPIVTEVRELRRIVDGLSASVGMDLSSLSREIASKWEGVSPLVESAKRELRAETDRRFEEAQGDHFIISQLVRELQKSKVAQQDTIDGIQHEVEKFNQFITDTPTDSMEGVVLRLERLDQDFRQSVAHHTEVEAKVDGRLGKIEASDQEFANEFHREVANIQSELGEVKHLVVDAPSFDIDGVVSTDTLIRAIQRNSRRIDTFNETVVAVKDENDALRDMFNEMAGCVQRIQIEMQTFVTEHNVVKAALVTQTDQSFVNSEKVRDTLTACEKVVHDVLNIVTKSMNAVSGTFIQIAQFLNRLTTRQLPVFQSFDDELLDLQKLCDAVSAQVTERERKDVLGHALVDKASRSKEVGADLTDDLRLALRRDFKLAIVDVPARRTGELRKRSLFLRPGESKEAPAPVPEAPKPEYHVDLEMRNQVVEVTRKLDLLGQGFERLRESIAAKVDNKADATQVERILDKVKSMTNASRDEILKLRRKMADFLEKGDLEITVQDILERQGGGERSRALLPQGRPAHAGCSTRMIVPDVLCHTPYQQIFTGQRPRKKPE